MFLFFIIAFLLLLFTKTQIAFKICIKEDEKNLSYIIIRIFRFIRFRMNLSIITDESGLFSITLRKTDYGVKMTNITRIWNILKRLNHIKNKYGNLIKLINSKIHISSLNVYSQIGAKDAAHTALIIGSLFALFSMVSYYLKQNYHLQKYNINILPNFQGSYFDMNMDCIIDFKIGHIIIAGLQQIHMKKKRRCKNWQIIL
jgi:hypothetical protein